MTAMIAETSRLQIRELTVDDAEFVLALVNEPSFLTHIGDKGVHSLDDARRFILDGPWKRNQKPGCGQFAVELKTDGTPIGVCGLLYRDSLDLTDIGFAFLPAHWRQGFACEAATAVMDYGRSTLGIKRIVALTSKENLASIALLEKLGMKFERMVEMSENDTGTAVYS
jgi:RimJ/RimL family protein N-acetyltransferase